MWVGGARRVVLLAACGAFGGAVHAGDPELATVLVADVLEDPVYLTHPPGDIERLFVLGKQGVISIISGGAVLEQPFLDLNEIVYTADSQEQGLLGLAFHPEYDSNGYFFVNYTREPDAANVVARYTVTADPNVADPDSALVIIVLPSPNSHHNGGWIDFGPNDGYLYIAIGDGGGGYDIFDDAQDLESLLGKILRLDVIAEGVACDDFPEGEKNYSIPPDNPFVDVDGADEIWAYGLRNPWRPSFDRETGDLYIADVGQATWEELNFQPAGSPGGENYGWDCMEATHCTAEQTCVCDDEALTSPIFEYSHLVGVAIVGGFVYRGCAIPELVGQFVFADRIGPFWRLSHNGTRVTEVVSIEDELDVGGAGPYKTTSLGQDAYGELYICVDPRGEIFKIVPAGGITDCNENGLADCSDVTYGNSLDVNGNGVPDECECLWDLDGDGTVGIVDFLDLLAQWGTDPGGPPDFDGDGDVGITDFLALLANWGPCP